MSYSYSRERLEEAEVRVYFNLTKKVYSVQTKQNGKWRLSHHTEQITLKNVSFKVYESGRNRVLRENKKYVHAYIIGTPTISTSTPEQEPQIVTYNPFKYSTFVIKENLTPIFTANYCTLILNPYPLILIS